MEGLAKQLAERALAPVVAVEAQKVEGTNAASTRMTRTPARRGRATPTRARGAREGDFARNCGLRKLAGTETGQGKSKAL
jgi:hypothetical protein